MSTLLERLTTGPLGEAWRARPLTVIDIGARHGVQPRWTPLGDQVRVIAFECDEAEHARLALNGGKNVLYLATALSRERGEADFHIAKSAGLSSFLAPNWDVLRRFPRPERFATVRVIRLKTETLDDQLAANGVNDVDFLKLDTQGTELAILEGARRVLEREALGFEIEVEFLPLYRDQPLFADVDAFARRKGFELVDLRPTYWKRAAGVEGGGLQGQLVFGDALYLRAPEALDMVLDAPDLESVERRRAKVARSLVVVLLYGYVDRAAALLEAAHGRGLVERSECDRLLGILRRHRVRADRAPYFRGRGRLAAAALALHDVLKLRTGWSKGVEHLGNEL